MLLGGIKLPAPVEKPEHAAVSPIFNARASCSDLESRILLGL
jgi:hypothetical protein